MPHRRRRNGRSSSRRPPAPGRRPRCRRPSPSRRRRPWSAAGANCPRETRAFRGARFGLGLVRRGRRVSRTQGGAARARDGQSRARVVGQLHGGAASRTAPSLPEGSGERPASRRIPGREAEAPSFPVTDLARAGPDAGEEEQHARADAGDGAGRVPGTAAATDGARRRAPRGARTRGGGQEAPVVTVESAPPPGPHARRAARRESPDEAPRGLVPTTKGWGSPPPTPAVSICYFWAKAAGLQGEKENGVLSRRRGRRLLARRGGRGPA